MLLRELRDKGATIAWSPFPKEAQLLALATKEGGGAGFDDYGGELQITRLNLSGGAEQNVAAVKTTGRFSSLTWGVAGTCQGSPGLGLLAGGMSDGVVNVWDPEKLVAATSAGSVSVDGEDSGFLCKIPGHEGPVRAVEFNPTPSAGHLIATGASDSKVFVVNLQQPTSPSVAAPDVLAHCAEPPREITSVAWNTQVAHILATATQSGSCLVWDLRTNKPWCQLKDASRSPFSSVAWNPQDGLYIVTATDDDINPLLRVWDLRSNTSTPLAELRGHTKGVLSMSWSAQDTSLLVSCGKDNRTIVWDMQLGQFLYDVPTPQSSSGSGAPGGPSAGGYGAYGSGGGFMGSGGGLMSGGGGGGFGGGGFGGGGGGAESLFGGMSTSNIGSGAGRRYQVKWSPKLPGILASCSFDRSVSVHSLVAAPLLDAAQQQQSGQYVGPAAASRAPRWLRRPCGASFGFGGHLVTFTNGGLLGPTQPGQHPHRGVHVSVLSTAQDSRVIAAAQAFADKLAGNNLPGLCEDKVKFLANIANDKLAASDKSIWSFMRVILDASQRHSLLEHLGHSTDALKAEVEAYSAAHGGSTAPVVEASVSPATPPQSSPPAPVPPPALTAMFQDGAADSAKTAEQLFGGFGESAPAESASLSSAFDAAPPVAPPTASVAVAAAQPPTPVHKPPAPAPSTAAVSGDALREIAMSPPTPHLLDSAGSMLLRRSLLMGDFASAVKCCFAQNRLADALLLAACGSEDLWKSAQEEYFKRSPSRFARMVSCIVKMDLTSLVQEHPLADWKEVLAMLATYAKTEQFTPLCEALGDRLRAAANTADFDASEAATLCYLCAYNPVKAVGQFYSQIGSRSVAWGHPLALHDFVEKVTVLRQAVEVSGGNSNEAEASADLDARFPEAGVFAAYANVLANAGALALANQYASLVKLPAQLPPLASGGGVEELLALRHRLHVAFGYDPATAPPLNMHHVPVLPSPAVTGAYSYPAGDASGAGYGYDASGYAVQSHDAWGQPTAAQGYYDQSGYATSGYGAPTTATTTAGYGAAYGAPAATTNGYAAPTTAAIGYGAPAAATSGYGAPAAATSGYGAPAAATSGYGAPAAATSGYGAPAAATSGYGAPAAATSGYGAPAAATSGYGTTAGYGGTTGYTAPAPASGYSTPGYGGGATGYAPAPAPVPAPAPAPAPIAPAPIAAPAPAPAPAAVGFVPPPAVERRTLPADGFVSSAGDPTLGMKYGNISASPIASPGGPVAAVAAPAPVVTITPETQAVLDTLNALAGHLGTVGVTPPERKMLDEAVKAVALLESRLKVGAVSAATVNRLQELTAACAKYDFRTANAHQTSMANFDWNDHKDWLKGLKHLISIGLKKYPTPAA